MKLPRDIDGATLAKKLTRVGFEVRRQSGSHIQLAFTNSGELITIPAHRPIKIGTLAQILKSVSEVSGLTREEILERLS